jgi:putative ABC transport system ATP-binding protein
MKTHLVVDSLVYGGFGPVSFELHGGEAIGIFGESGCGKTRLLRAIADLDPHDGSVSLDNVEATSTSAPQWRRKVAYLPAESRWWFDSVRAHFKSPPQAQELHSVGLPASILNAEVSHLSSGEKQRLSLLRAMENHPSVLLLDEITAHLDAERTEFIENKVNTLMRDHNVAILWVSHNLKQLRKSCSEIMYMSTGGVFFRKEQVPQ